MIKSEFKHTKASESIGTSGDDTAFVVETLDDGIGDFTPGLEPVEKEGFISPKCACDFLHGLDTGTKCGSDPVIEEAHDTTGSAVVPKLGKVFLEDVGADGSQVAAEKLLESFTAFSTDALPSAEQQPAGFGQYGFAAAAPHIGGLGTAGFIDRLVELNSDVEGIEDVKSLGHIFGDGFEERPPHIGANEADGGKHLGLHGTEELYQTALSAGAADPEQASASGVDLVDEGEKPLGTFAFAPMEFVDADGRHPHEITVSQSPFDDVIDGSADALPTGSENNGGFLPCQAARPTGQELHEGQRHLAFPAGPWDPFGGDAMDGTSHPSRGVNEHHGDHPERHEFIIAGTGMMVVAGSGFVALSTPGRVLPMRTDMHYDLWSGHAVAQLHIFVNETLDRVNAIEYRFDGQAHGWGDLLFSSQRMEDSLQPLDRFNPVCFKLTVFAPQLLRGQKRCQQAGTDFRNGLSQQVA